VCGKEGVDGYHKRDPEMLSKRLLKDVTNGRVGEWNSIMKGKKE
jgi:hypothetical protein